MKAKLYDLMNWAEIEGIVYSEEDKPASILGPHTVGSSTLYQAFFPDAKKVTLILEDKNKRVSMDVADEEGFFAALSAGKKSIHVLFISTLFVGTTSKEENRKPPRPPSTGKCLNKLQSIHSQTIMQPQKRYNLEVQSMECEVRLPGFLTPPRPNLCE